MLDDNIIEIWEIDINNENLKKSEEKISCLSELEKQKLYGFKFIKDYRVYLISHVAMRELLSRYLGRESHKIKYKYGEKGKPGVGGGIYFNLSHTNNKALIGFYKKDIGIDIEYKKEIEDYNGIGELVFTEEEIEYINNDSNKKKDRFYEIWTKKEAIIKSIGKGLSEEVKRISIGRRKDFYCGKYLWQIKRIEINKQYIAHIAYKNNDPIKITLSSFK